MHKGPAIAIAFVSVCCTRAVRAGSLEADIDAIHAVDADIASASPRERPVLLGRAARLKQAAIARAIEVFGIDVTRASSGVHYSPAGGMHDREGATIVDADGSVR